MQQRPQTTTVRDTHECSDSRAARHFVLTTLLTAGLLAIAFVPMFVLGAVLGVSGYTLTARMQAQESPVTDTDPQFDAPVQAKNTA